MPRLSDLGEILVECRVAARDRWDAAARAGGGDLARVLAALADDPPGWWDGKPPAPPGLTDYQRRAVQARYAANELDLLGRDLAVNQFVLLDKLGQGGQGEVYRGRQLNPPRFAAVKTLVRDTETRRRRFEQEARTMMKIRHPAVARFYLYERVRDAHGGLTDEYLIAMELVTGTDLNRLVRRGEPVAWPFAVKWVIDLLGGLAVIHQHGFVHRDVKPENVMIVGPAPGPETGPDETAAKLLDFGAVTRAGSGPETDAAGGRIFLGTMEYAPPEQWTGEVVAASDLYALGGALFFMLTGRTPYHQSRRDPAAYRDAHTRDDIPDLREHASGVPQRLNWLFQQLMAKDPGERGSAAELVDEFGKLLPRSIREPEPPGPQPRPAPVAPRQPAAKPVRKKIGPEAAPRGVSHPILTVFERVFLSRRLRPVPGSEPTFQERLATLLRQPLVLILLAVVLTLLLLRIF